MRNRMAMAAIVLGLWPVAAAGLSLDQALPRGRDICYGGPAKAGAVARLRLTRPERLQSYDSARSRVVRIVINFAAPAGARIEDTATCRAEGGDILCASTSCEGAAFSITEERDGSLRVRLQNAVPGALWSCSDGDVRKIALGDADKNVAVRTSRGSCIEGE